MARAYFGLYAVTKAGLDVLVRTYAVESEASRVRVNLFSPGQTRTRMMATAFPGIDPMTLPTAETVAAAIVPLCLQSCNESGKLYDYRAAKFLQFNAPA
jgi:NAD(P)-dependent dehydrogenase (short-subunit alcohol dehydrogenase family)